MPHFIASATDLHTPSSGLTKEWLVTNGRGGYAASSILNINTRRYHGLLVAAPQDPADRFVLVAGLEEHCSLGAHSMTLATGGTAPGSGVHALSNHEYHDGTIHPQGYLSLARFELDHLLPIWTYSFGSTLIEKRIWMVHGEDTTVVSYRLLTEGELVNLMVRPLCALRHFHYHQHAPRTIELSAANKTAHVYLPDRSLQAFITAPSGTFQSDPAWYWHFAHREERTRGLDTNEDLYAPGTFTLPLSSEAPTYLILSATAQLPSMLEQSYAKEHHRRSSLLKRVQLDPAWIQTLTIAADAFVISRPIPDSAESGTSIIAGYHWFADWSRDSMISLPGLLLAQGRLKESASMLRSYSRLIHQGMLPNRFVGGDTQLEWNSVDGTLWYVVALYEHYLASKDKALIKELFGSLHEIIEWYSQGTRFGIHVDTSDSLLFAGERGVQLTWMDAKVGDWVVTPRVGKPVEINALWYNALSIASTFATLLRQKKLKAFYDIHLERVHQGFQRFYDAEAGYLSDVLDTPEAFRSPTTKPDGRDSTLRPNQLLAVSLPFSPVSRPLQKAIVDSCADALYTPVGLRSRAADGATYCGRYQGSPLERDRAYHQGTVWAWLLGPFLTAHLKVYRERSRTKQLLLGIEPHLNDGCIGSINEIFSGDVPHNPAGCVAQAWSVGEVLRTWELLREER